MYGVGAFLRNNSFPIAQGTSPLLIFLVSHMSALLNVVETLLSLTYL